MSKRSKGVDGPADRYDVGYGRPPLHSRFQPGQSGNPRGRPRRRQNLSTIVGKLACQTMIITEGGRPRRVPRYVALQLIQWAKALSGDSKAYMAIQQSVRDAGLLRAEVEPVQPEISPDDQNIVQDYLMRVGIKPVKKATKAAGKKRQGQNNTPSGETEQ